ncbi:MAG: ABC transporter permease [Clostridia bacterium]|nr:ABC transporter permease [Clostridia bacterium]
MKSNSEKIAEIKEKNPQPEQASSAAREPLFHVSKNSVMSRGKALAIRGCSLLAALIITGILGVLLVHINPFRIYKEIFKGPFVDIWTMLQDTALLLCFALAVVPAFKMKFFNMGANGQVLVGCLAAIGVMKFLTPYMPNWAAILLMLVVACIAGVIFAVIPAVFKAWADTNETLFTLMMNYIAIELVNYLVFVWDKSGSGTLGIVNLISHAGWVPNIGNKYVLPVIVAVLMTVFMTVYMNYSKHGFEAALVGESVNTAKYVGINVKKVMIRTLALSGLLCGILGFVYAGAVSHTVNAAVGGKGFTAILVAWLAGFNPPIMALVALLVTFLTSGTQYASSSLHLGSTDFASITVGIFFFFVIGSEFFIRYRVELTARGKKVFKIKSKKGGEV